MSETSYDPRAFRRQLLRTAVLDGALGVCLLLAVELCLRLFVPATRQFVFTDKLTGGRPVTVNRLGLRDDEVDRDFPADGVRIMVIGNSVTFGYGVGDNDTFSQQLERILKDRRDGVRYDVINGSGQGSSVREKIEFLDKEGWKLGLDAVVLVLSASNVAMEKEGAEVNSGRIDASAAAPPKTWKQRLKSVPLSIHVWLFAHSRTYAVWDRLGRWNLFRLGVMKEKSSLTWGPLFAYGLDAAIISEPRKCYRNLDENLRRLKQDADAHGVPLFVVAIPSRFEISDRSVDNPRGVDKSAVRIIPGRRFAEMAEQWEIPFLDMAPVFAALRQREEADPDLPFLSLYIPADFVHLNPDGHRLVAEEIAGRFITGPYLPALRGR